VQQSYSLELTFRSLGAASKRNLLHRNTVLCEAVYAMVSGSLEVECERSKQGVKIAYRHAMMVSTRESYV
jgi:hypothetical protein